MRKVVYISKSSIEPKRGTLRTAHLPGEPQPECSYTRERNRSILEVAKSYSFRNSTVSAFEETLADPLPGRAGKDLEED